jgi:hypothetical protein
MFLHPRAQTIKISIFLRTLRPENHNETLTAFKICALFKEVSSNLDSTNTIIMGASNSSGSVAAPLFITMAIMIVAIPVVIIVINILHKRRVRKLSESDPLPHPAPKVESPAYQQIPESWKRMLKRRTREEWVERAIARKSTEQHRAGVDLEMGRVEKAHFAVHNNVKAHGVSHGAGLVGKSLPKTVEGCITDGRNPLVEQQVRQHAENLGRTGTQKTYSSTATTVGGNVGRSTSKKTTASQKIPSIERGVDGYFPMSFPSGSKKPKVKRHLDASLYATLEKSPDSPTLPSQDQPRWGFNAVGNINADPANTLRATHEAHERMQKSPLTRFEDAYSKRTKGKADSPAVPVRHSSKGKEKQRDITEVFNQKRQQSQLRKKQELEQALGSKRMGKGKARVDEDEEDLAFTNAELRGKGVHARDFA